MADAGNSSKPLSWKHRTLYSAISAALAAGYSGGVYAQAESGNNDVRLEEVIVSARKRDENIQDIPQSIQSFSAEDINRAGITSLADLARFVPSLTVIGASPGLSKIVFRGLADSPRPFIADSSAAIYLDEQPLTTGAQSPDIRPIDLERIETLAGPQGTLYGASSQSGTLRYIVAKPDVTQFEANAGGGTHSIEKGDTGWDVDGMVNIPLLQDKVAVRLVGFAAKDAGYIDNVLGSSPGRLDAETGEQVPGSKTNANVVGNDINSADWVGGRASIKWLVNDNWSVTDIVNYSDSKIKGFNDYDPTTGDLETVKFFDERFDDEWWNNQLSVEGDLGFAQLDSALAYFERDTAYTIDGTSGVAYYHSVLGVYGRGNCATQYAADNIYDFATACELNGVGYDVDDGDPTGFNRNDQTDKRWTWETRLSGSTSRWDWTLGFFYQEADQEWEYGTHIDGYADTESFAAYRALFGDIEPTDISFSSAEKSTRTDYAVFGETTISLTESWKLLLGARWYDAEIDRRYSQTLPGTGPTDVTTPDGGDDGWLPKVALQYFLGEEQMLYALYSEGYRAGGTNRARGEPTLPVQYESDLLKNYEGGIKSRWLDGRLQVNVIAYHQKWEDMQLELTDPAYQFDEPFQTVIANVGDAEVEGVDLDTSFLFNESWTVGFVATHLFTAEIPDEIAVFDERAPDDFALFIPGGTQLPLASKDNMAAYAEYSTPVAVLGGSDAFLRLQYSYTGSSWNRLVDNDGDPTGTGYGGRAKNPSYDTFDLRCGVNNSTWEISMYVDNLTDERQTILRDTAADLFWGRDRIVTGQPRTLGLNVRRYFN